MVRHSLERAGPEDDVMSRFHDQTTETLHRAGWREGRRVDVETWRAALAGECTMHAAAAEFLAEFGGLEVAVGGRLVDRPVLAFDLDPLLGEGDGERLAAWGEDLGRSLFPVGAFTVGHPFVLAVDETGEVYHVGESIASYGVLPGALDTLVRGVPRPLFEDPAPVAPGTGKVAKHQRRPVTRSVRTAYRSGPGRK
jgi:hypothetical protein